MTICKDCRHPQANHHSHVGACTHHSVFFGDCTCRRFQPLNAFRDEQQVRP